MGITPGRRKWGPESSAPVGHGGLYALHELRDGHSEALGEHVDAADAGLFPPILQLADVNVPKSRQFREIELVPALRRPQLAEASSQPDAHIYCHFSSVCVSL